jgi:hypothetical protein
MCGVCVWGGYVCGVCVCGVCVWVCVSVCVPSVCLCVCLVCVCVCVYVCGYLPGRDYVMECAGGRVESSPVRRVGCSLLSTVLWLVYCAGGIFVSKKIPSSSFSSLYCMVFRSFNVSFAVPYSCLLFNMCIT